MEHLEHFEDYRRTRARTYTSIEEEVFQVFQVPAAADRWHVVCRLLALEQIREFVRWWDEGVKSRGNPEKKGSDLKNSERRSLTLADAESLTGISQQQVSRWRKRIKDEAAR